MTNAYFPSAAMLVIAALLAACSAANDWDGNSASPDQSPRMAARILGPDDGERLDFPDGRSALLKITAEDSGSRSLMIGTEQIPGGTAIPVHSHDEYEEAIFIHEGHPLLTLGDRSVRAEPGTTVFVPPGTWHGVSSDGSEATTMLFIFPDPAIAGFFRQVGQREGEPPPDLTPADWAEIMRQHAMRSRD